MNFSVVPACMGRRVEGGEMKCEFSDEKRVE